MIYLISQILLCLALAALLGGAIGWLLQRSRADARLAAARRVLAEQTRQLERARTDVTMLTDDFDDLRERSRVEIDALREENRQLPALTENLGKSQLLVRQMIQRHDSQVRELEAIKSALEAQIARLQEQVVTQERALAAAARAARARATGDGAAEASGTEPLPPPITQDATASGATDVAGPAVGTSPDASGPASAAATRAADTDAAMLPTRGRATVPLAGGDGPDEIMDEVMEVDDDLAAELLVDAETPASPAQPSPTASDDAAERAPDAAPTHREGADDARPPATHADRFDRDVEAAAPAAEPAAETAGEEDFDDAWDENEDGNATLAIEVFSMDDVHGVEDLDDTARSAQAHANDGSRPALLFRPVGHQDDLKRIVGIGAVTEKALNELGITSYSQLAELDRPEVEKIAAALDIGPERIEQDDWVGKARRQLEDVLEEL